MYITELQYNQETKENFEIENNPNENNIGKIFYALNIIYDIPSTPGAQYASETDLGKAIKVLVDMVNTNTVENAVCKGIFNDDDQKNKLEFEFADTTHNTLHAGYGTPRADLRCKTEGEFHGSLYDVKTISTLNLDKGLLYSSNDSCGIYFILFLISRLDGVRLPR